MANESEFGIDIGQDTGPPVPAWVDKRRFFRYDPADEASEAEGDVGERVQ